jgi:hypothetical protein
VVYGEKFKLGARCECWISLGMETRSRTARLGSASAAEIMEPGQKQEEVSQYVASDKETLQLQLEIMKTQMENEERKVMWEKERWEREKEFREKERLERQEKESRDYERWAQECKLKEVQMQLDHQYRMRQEDRTEDKGAKSWKGVPKMDKLQSDGDPAAFFAAFENLMIIRKINESDWAGMVVELLSGKALETYGRLSQEEAKSYREIKSAVFARFEVSAESNRQQFRGIRRDDVKNEMYSEFATRLQEAAKRWLTEADVINNAGKLFETIVMEQFTSILPVELKIWLAEKKTSEVSKAARLLDDYLEVKKLAHATAVGVSAVTVQGVGEMQVRPGYAGSGGQGKDYRPPYRPPPPKFPQPPPAPPSKPPRPTFSSSGEIICYRCSQPGHVKAVCPYRYGNYYVASKETPCRKNR